MLRHALRVGGASAVGEALVLAVHLTKGYWVLITIAVVLRPYAAITLQRTVLRLAGTMLGAALAAAILIADDQSVGLILIVFVLTFLTFSLISLNYGLGVVFLTPLVIVLISTGQPGDWGVAGHRVLDTLIGAGLALLGGYLLWPKVDRRELVDELAAALEADRLHLRAVFAARLIPPTPPIAAAVAPWTRRPAWRWPMPRPPSSAFWVSRPGAGASRRRCGPSPTPPDGRSWPPVRSKVTWASTTTLRPAPAWSGRGGTPTGRFPSCPKPCVSAGPRTRPGSGRRTSPARWPKSARPPPTFGPGGGRSWRSIPPPSPRWPSGPGRCP